jgi:hypothetical protein
VRRREEMYLHDNLHVCLLALANRYPNNLIESNRTVLGAQAFCPGCRTALEVIAWLQRTEPALLEKNAFLVVIDAQKCEIYLTGGDEQTPAYRIHCRGKMPLHTEESSLEQA